MNDKTNRLLPFYFSILFFIEHWKLHNSMCMLASFAFQMFAAETCRCLLMLVSLLGLTGKGGFGCFHSGIVEIESARDLSMCLNPVAFSRAVCLFAFGCVLEYLPDSVLELAGSCRTLSLVFIMTVLLHTVGSSEAARLWLFLCLTGPLLVCQWQSLRAGDSQRWKNLQTRPRKQCLYFSR